MSINERHASTKAKWVNINKSGPHASCANSLPGCSGNEMVVKALM